MAMQIGVGYTGTVLLKNGASFVNRDQATGISTADNCDSGKLTSIVVPAATLGALGCGYMW
ncbi:hypothetical protein GOBAR_AA19294 [Gossypium barbadense]|uniref:Uncharacterized protein n=1 Tax=Gossypium barbadense TaxID=3634 RepID=A0A2P5XDE9_GOSBA|nr:hypothetical protein GOBAR_AA19294 [Gossypium barbadense]